MTKSEFENIILPFLHYYFNKTTFYRGLGKEWGEPIRIGNMILFCTKSYIPDDIIIVDHNDNIVDGYHVCRDNLWNGVNIKDKLISLGMWREEDV